MSSNNLHIEMEPGTGPDLPAGDAPKERVSILYIEDDVAMHRMFKMLESSRLKDFQFTIAATLAEGQAELKNHANRYQAVLSDYHLPDGEAKSLFPLEVDLPVVVLTATYDVGLAVELIKLGADDFLVKDGAMKFIQLLPEKINSVIEKKEAEREAERHKRRFRDLFDNVNDTILYVDNAGTIVHANPMLPEVLGYPASGRVLLPSLIHPAERHTFEDKLASLGPGQKLDDYVMRVLGKEGKEFIMEVSVSKSLADEDASWSRIILHNVTEQKRQEQMIRQQNKDLERKNKQINEGIIKLRNMTVSRRSVAFVAVIGIAMFLLSEFWLEPTLIRYSGNSNYTWINKTVIVLLLKPIDMIIERWLLRIKIREAGLS